MKLNIEKIITITSLILLTTTICLWFIYLSNTIKSKDNIINMQQSQIDSLKSEIVLRDMYYERIKLIVQ